MFSWDKDGAQYFMKSKDLEMSALHTTFFDCVHIQLYQERIFDNLYQ